MEVHQVHQKLISSPLTDLESRVHRELDPSDYPLPGVKLPLRQEVVASTTSLPSPGPREIGYAKTAQSHFSHHAWARIMELPRKGNSPWFARSD